MCGITGWLSSGAPADRNILQAMTAALAHRGPDADGIWVDGAVGFGHRRLSVIDTRDIANQPMEDLDGRAVIVFNGEIYNFRELRTELEGLGHRFRTLSDTEVVLEAYKRWGFECLARFNGMFAFAMWDRDARHLFLARDRAGEKPLFYAQTDRGFLFGSEPRALKRHPAVGHRIDADALVRYLAHNYVPGERTLVSGVRRLPPASYLIVRPGEAPVVQRFWSLAPFYGAKRPWKDEAEASEALAALLDDATRMRLVSDVPLGAFLSGGVDSASVVAAMSVASNEVYTFSVGFTESGYDEVAQARETAQHLAVKHADRVLDLDLPAMIQAIVHAADEPLADNSALPTWFLCRFAREHVSVALSGDGGDELFAGYETYVASQLARRLSLVPPSLWRALHGAFDTMLPVTFGKVNWEHKIRYFLKGLQQGWPQAHFAWRTIFDDDERARLVRDDVRSDTCADGPYAAFESAYAEASDTPDELDRLLCADTQTWLVDDILVKSDRMSMAHGLEVRTPFLDHRVMEFAAVLPADWKLKGGRTKHILKESQRNRLPPSVLNRRKQGFNAPMSHWLRGILKEFSGDCLASPRLDDWMVRTEIDRLWRDHQAGRRDNGFRLYGLICLSLWLDSNRENAGAAYWDDMDRVRTAGY